MSSQVKLSRPDARPKNPDRRRRAYAALVCLRGLDHVAYLLPPP